MRCTHIYKHPIHVKGAVIVLHGHGCTFTWEKITSDINVRNLNKVPPSMSNTIYRGKVLDKYWKWVNNLGSRLGQLHKNTVVVPNNETAIFSWHLDYVCFLYILLF